MATLTAAETETGAMAANAEMSHKASRNVASGPWTLRMVIPAFMFCNRFPEASEDMPSLLGMQAKFEETDAADGEAASPGKPTAPRWEPRRRRGLSSGSITLEFEPRDFEANFFTCRAKYKSDKRFMPCFGCTSNSFRSISRAMAKAASARFRQMGLTTTATHWAERASICETCPMRVVNRGISYCGTPFLKQINRDPVTEGCGCPTHDKAKSPNEHCPVDRHFNLPVTRDGECNCRWCAAAKAASDI